MRWFSHPRARWYLLAALWLGLLALGIGGFLQQARDSGDERSVLDTLYLTVQLATLEYGAGDDTLNWRLEIARFVAPLMAAGTVAQTASVVFADQFRRARLRFARGHTVVCGLGDAGGRLAESFVAAGQRVAAIEADAGAAGVSRARDHGVTVLIGDASDAATLRAARVDRAARLVAVRDDDAANVQIAIAAAEVTRDRRGSALRCAVHLTDAELAALLRGADLAGRGGARISYFNLHERAARSLIAEHPPFGDADQTHLAVVGLGQLGRSLVVALAQQWAEDHCRERVRLTLVDRAASGRWEAMRLQYPALSDACAARPIDLDFDAPGPGSVDELMTLLREDPPTWIAVAFDDESLALSTALFVRDALQSKRPQIVVRVRTAGGLGGLLTAASEHDGSPSSVAIFPFLDRTCTVDAVDGSVREQLARAVHESYLAGLPAADHGRGLALAWDELDDEQRDLSRRRVDGILGDLAALRYDISPLARWGTVAAAFDDREVELLAAREHRRWFDDRVAGGWTHGPVRDDAARRNPLLTPWEKLPADVQARNIEAARRLPLLLARAGFEASRR